jgi:predicted PolB exonuclease-like 3'-5' exonuclease
MSNVIVWDIETVPDLQGFAAANGHEGKTDDEVRAELGDKFPKHIYHSIICIGALDAPAGTATANARAVHRRRH